jgi:cytochrome c biogenesis protein ResB
MKKGHFLLRIFSSPVLLVILLVLIIAGSIGGSLLPLQQAYSLVFGSFWFLLLFILLILNIIGCMITYRKTHIKNPGILLCHISIFIIFIGVIVSLLQADRGYLELVEGNSKQKGVREDNTLMTLPFKVKLENFILEKHSEKIIQELSILDKTGQSIFSEPFSSTESLNKTFQGKNIQILQIIKDFRINKNGEIYSFSNEWKNPAIQIKIGNQKGWLFARYDVHDLNQWGELEPVYNVYLKGGEIKDFISKITIIEDQKPILTKSVEVNHPLYYRGYTIYQYNFDPNNLNWSGLMVKKDPGIPVVYTGYLFIILGILYQLYVINKHGKFYQRLDKATQPDNEVKS